MKVTRIDVEGRAGYYATISRKRGMRSIAITMLTPDQPDGVTAAVDPADGAGQLAHANRLQKELDGYEGTIGDRIEYLRAIQTFAD